MLFIIGIIEMIIISVWTKVVTDNKILTSGIITFINILIWYYVLESVVSDINNIQLILFYALGCTIGTMLTVSYYSWQEKNQQKKNGKKYSLIKTLKKWGLVKKIF